MREARIFLTISAVMGCLAVILGAFGAHGIKEAVDTYHLGIFKTGNQYHFYHSFALMIVGLLARNGGSKVLASAGICFIIGIFLFSGSLYGLTFTETLPTSIVRVLGPITPIGGIFFVFGWGLLAIFTARKFNQTTNQTS